MEREIRDNDYVIIVWTPQYKAKSEGRMGGVGYEGDIMTAEVFAKRNHRKFIPVLARGTWAESAPAWLSGKNYVDLSDTARYAERYQNLLTTILWAIFMDPMKNRSNCWNTATTSARSAVRSNRSSRRYSARWAICALPFNN